MQVQKVEICGVIIEAFRRDGCVQMRLDDSTGLIACVWWDTSYDAREAGRLAVERSVPLLGTTLHVMGQLGYFRDERQIRVDLAWMDMDPLSECLHWVSRECRARASCAVEQRGAPQCPNTSPAHTLACAKWVAHCLQTL
jgi:hypothetical protein